MKIRIYEINRVKVLNFRLYRTCCIDYYFQLSINGIENKGRNCVEIVKWRFIIKFYWI